MTAVVMVLGSIAAGPAGAATSPERAQPRIQISADDVVVDERVRIVVKGLEPRQEVRVVLSMERSDGVWESAATFTADRRGRVRLPKAEPTGGDYTGVDPMGLFWSAHPPPGAAANATEAEPETETVTVTAEVDGDAVASTTLVRRFLAEDVEVVDVREDGVVGTLFRPSSSDPLPGLVVLGGSEGGIPWARAAAFASNGYAALALAYFDPSGQLAGVPPALRSIPLETFDAALDWLRSQPAVDDARIGIVGASRGAEAALLVASERPEIDAVVAYAPSHVVWPDLTGTGPAWSRGGEAVPFVPARPAPGPLVDVFSVALTDDAAVARAAIPVERIDGAVLLISGADDQLWPSAQMGDEVITRLEANDHSHRSRHLVYPGAGHLIVVPYQPTTTLAEPAGSPFALGGNADDAARASAEHWRKVLRFLDRNL